MVKRERTESSRRLKQMTAGTLSALMLFTSLSLPVWGDDVVPEKRILTVQSGSSTASVNGTSYTIAKPQLKQGVLMVPLGVFKSVWQRDQAGGREPGSTAARTAYGCARYRQQNRMD